MSPATTTSSTSTSADASSPSPSSAEPIDFIVAEQTAIHERSAGATQALYGAAANEPELDSYLAELIAGVGRQIRRILEICAERSWLRR